MPCPLPFGVIPVVVLPLAVFAMLVTTLLAVPFAVVRRWWVVFNVAISAITLYVVRFTFEGFCKRLDTMDTWWARPSAFWAAVCVAAAAGAIWVRCRMRSASRTDSIQQPLCDRLVLSSISLVCLAVAAYCFWDARQFLPPFLVVCLAVWAGTLYALVPHVSGLVRLTTQEVTLWAVVFASSAVGAAGLVVN
jgi:hypothetical protein